MLERMEVKIIPFADWRREIAPLWMMDGSYRLITSILNGHGQMQYVGRELTQRVLLFPLAAHLAGERVGWCSIYNISDEAVRVRGIYVLPEFRSSGVGYAMVAHAMTLWPENWRWCYMYARGSNVERYKRWGFSVAGNHQARTWEEGEALNDGQIVLMQKAMPSPEARVAFPDAA